MAKSRHYRNSKTNLELTASFFKHLALSKCRGTYIPSILMNGGGLCWRPFHRFPHSITNITLACPSNSSPGATTTEETLPDNRNNNPRNSNCNPNYFKPPDQECCSNICVDRTFIPALLNNSLASAHCRDTLTEYFRPTLKYAGKCSPKHAICAGLPPMQMYQMRCNFLSIIHVFLAINYFQRSCLCLRNCKIDPCKIATKITKMQ